ncbi:hypothetical protein MRB53_005414 [Persea americana]|uniref:Uncharacterized protein n=1 Tax=Persea americana TaxID=3435 RepID=A0ACC2MDD9_PERAE|nr:hypothetical protein MRB53_005414 [Persea americana]
MRTPATRGEDSSNFPVTRGTGSAASRRCGAIPATSSGTVEPQRASSTATAQRGGFHAIFQIARVTDDRLRNHALSAVSFFSGDLPVEHRTPSFYLFELRQQEDQSVAHFEISSLINPPKI